jgi:hypothetical protein
MTAKIYQLLPTENQEQRALVKWIRTQPKFDNVLIKLNNEGKRTAAQGWHLKLMGMCTGASDLFLAFPTPEFHGLWLEIKQNRKYQPSEKSKPTWIGQEKFLKKMISMGYDGHFCYGWEDGKRVIERYVAGGSICRINDSTLLDS